VHVLVSLLYSYFFIILNKKKSFVEFVQVLKDR
jgi:hypothetical protein